MRNLIFTGPRGSGKTYLSDLIIEQVDPRNVLKINAMEIGIAEITSCLLNTDFKIVVFEECYFGRIELIYEVIKDMPLSKGKTFIYITQDKYVNPLEEFQVIECTY
jgi:predicted AAA+ superfamily ATPase